MTYWLLAFVGLWCLFCTILLICAIRDGYNRERAEMKAMLDKALAEFKSRPEYNVKTEYRIANSQRDQIDAFVRNANVAVRTARAAGVKI